MLFDAIIDFFCTMILRWN